MHTEMQTCPVGISAFLCALPTWCFPSTVQCKNAKLRRKRKIPKIQISKEKMQKEEEKYINTNTKIHKLSIQNEKLQFTLNHAQYTPHRCDVSPLKGEV